MRLTTTQSKKVQILRATAIAGVVIIHCCPNGLPQVFVRPLVNFCVALFVFLSGCLTKAEQGDLRAFYRRRVSRVLPPYVIWTGVYTLGSGETVRGGCLSSDSGSVLCEPAYEPCVSSAVLHPGVHPAHVAHAHHRPVAGHAMEVAALAGVAP